MIWIFLHDFIMPSLKPYAQFKKEIIRYFEKYRFLVNFTSNFCHQCDDKLEPVKNTSKGIKTNLKSNHNEKEKEERERGNCLNERRQKNSMNKSFKWYRKFFI